VAKVGTSNQDRTISIKAAVRSCINKETNKQNTGTLRNDHVTHIIRAKAFHTVFPTTILKASLVSLLTTHAPSSHKPLQLSNSKYFSH
jgi:hypothetical protein